LKTLNLLRIALLALALPGIMAASILTTSPNPSDLGDLNHDTVWSWRIDNVDLGGHEITSASLTLAGIYNNDNSSNRLFIHLLDSVPNAGTAHRSDPYSTIRDYFLTPSSSFAPQPGPSNVLLDAPSFAGGQANKVDYNYTFTAEQLTILQSFIANNGNLAFGFDPDCHFYNSGISFQMTTAQAPEPGTSLLVGVCLLFGVPVLRRFAPLKSKTRADQASIEPRS
jgi:hypothetical protein